MGGPQVEAFLSDLATVGKVAAATQNQALSALLFLYREVLQVDLPWMDGVVRAKRPKHVPVVLTESEVRALLAHLDGTRWLVLGLLYSSGARLQEGLRLRVKDVDFERHEITVRDRVTMLPERLVEPLRSHLVRVSPVRIELLGRHSVCGALVLGNQVLLGSIPMEDMDLIVEPARLKVSVNPQAPNIPMSVATGSQPR